MAQTTTPREQFQEAVMGFRKAAYEFGMADNPEDHETMLVWQRRVFALYDEAAGNAGAPGCPESGKHCNVIDGECQTCGAAREA
jgi:hypothetical protein